MTPPSAPASPPARIGEWLAYAAARLAIADHAALLEAQVLLAHVLGCGRTRLYARPEETLPEAQARRFAALVERRRAGEPVAYLTGTREFWSLTLAVTPDVLIPRPETERLVELALAELAPDAGARIADLGTGSGALALALAHERPRAHIVATDSSAAALAVARANAARLGLDRIEWRRGDWCRALDPRERFELIVSNPPYVRAGDPHLVQGDVRFEPRTALAAGPDGLDAVRRIAWAARRVLAADGMLLLEHAPEQAPAVQALLRRYGYRDIATHADHRGHPRATGARHPGGG